MSRALLHLLLAIAVLAGTLPCSCWAALLPAPKKMETASVTVAEEDCCSCCRAKKLAASKNAPAPEKPQTPSPGCPPGCFSCLGAVTPSPVMVPVVSLPEPAMDDAVAMHIPLAPQQAIDQLVPPPRTAL